MTSSPAVPRLTGLFVPLITPFLADGGVDAAALRALACQVLDDGAAGLVALGTTAEAATLTSAERHQVLQVCSTVCRDRSAILIAGAGSNDTTASAAALRELASWPDVTAALTVVPYYTRPGEAGVLAHFRGLAAASPVPLVIYHIPYRTGQPLTTAALLALAALPGVAGVKHAPGGIDGDTVELIGSAPETFAVLAGDDLVAPGMLGLGAPGAVMASAHVCTTAFAGLVRAWGAGDAVTARPLGHRLAALSAALFAEPNPAVIKAVLHEQGRIATTDVRLPLLPASAEATAVALARAAEAGRLAAEPAMSL
ncbi:MAG TPA: 4-hydroxy-tetrahydrodipicolinate synthase [Streptosporangiaceae bacterium]